MIGRKGEIVRVAKFIPRLSAFEFDELLTHGGLEFNTA